MPGKLIVVAGGQFGSEGKGAIAAHLCYREAGTSSGPEILMGVRTGGPNAGHTVIGRCPSDCPDGTRDPGSFAALVADRPHTPDGHPWRLRHVPVAAVSAPGSSLYLAEGSEIDPLVLLGELEQLDKAGYDASSRLRVHPQATVITPENVADELTDGLTRRLGSTSKGIGAARAMRIMRRAPLVRDHDAIRYLVTQVQVDPQYHLRKGGTVLIEGTQGYGLGLHAGYYPYCTSQDCRPQDFIALAGIAPWTASLLQLWLVFRPYPIRVAGNSGPLQDETTWEELGLPQEHTTVTRKVRRVGLWDGLLAQRAIQAAGPGNHLRVAMTMVDHLIPGLAGRTGLESQSLQRKVLARTLTRFEDNLGEAISLIGTGPASVLPLLHSLEA